MANIPYTFSPPPRPHPPPSHPPKTSLPMLYYGLVVVGTTAIVLALYNLVLIKWCANHHQTRLRNVQQSLDVRRRLDNNNMVNLGGSFKYKKGGEECLKLGFDNYECPVCLSVFEEEEEVRQLPRCKHSFHAPCIDMWLYSHLDCPLCRTPVEVELPVFSRQTAVATPVDRSREMLIGILA